MEELMTVQTTRGELKFYRDWDRCEGSVVMINAQTIKRYKELKDGLSKIDLPKFDCFFAFSNEQFERNIKTIRPLKEGEKLIRIAGGGFITEDGLTRLNEYTSGFDEKIKNECDPQEVYFYEYNNHECMFSYGDEDAINAISRYWDKDTINNLYRL